MNMQMFRLPFPPSVNTYWRSISRGRCVTKILSKRAREYRAEALRQINVKEPLRGDLGCTLYLYPPDKRRRDVDNYSKGVLDALGHAQVYEDDSQISVLRIERMQPQKPGSVVVQLWEREDATAKKRPDSPDWPLGS